MEAVRISCAGFAYKQPYASVLAYFYPLYPAALAALRPRRRHSAADLTAVAAAAGGAALLPSPSGRVRHDAPLLASPSRRVRQHDPSTGPAVHANGGPASTHATPASNSIGSRAGSLLGPASHSHDHSHAHDDPSGRQHPNAAAMDAPDLVGAVQRLLHAAGVTQYYLGKTKLFLKSAQAAQLDRQRGRVLGASATRIQADWRGHLARRRFLLLRAAAMVLQAGCRAQLARRLAEALRQERAAVVVQAAWRRVAAQRWLVAARDAAVALQAAWRARCAALELRAMKW
jgi:hypothetical protein